MILLYFSLFNWWKNFSYSSLFGILIYLIYINFIFPMKLVIACSSIIHIIGGMGLRFWPRYVRISCVIRLCSFDFLFFSVRSHPLPSYLVDWPQNSTSPFLIVININHLDRWKCLLPRDLIYIPSFSEPML